MIFNYAFIVFIWSSNQLVDVDCVIVTTNVYFKSII